MKDATMQLFHDTRESVLTELIQRFALTHRADTDTIRSIFNAGWQACLDFNSKAEVLERDADAVRRGE